MAFKSYIFYYAVITFILVEAYSVPSKQNIIRDHFKRKEQLEHMKQLEDEDVQELKNLKSSKLTSISEVNIQKSTDINVNGKKEQQAESTQQVNKNGELVERIHQKIHSKQESKSATPETQILTEIEIPSRGVHNLYEEDAGLQNVIKKKFEPKHEYVQNKLTDIPFDDYNLKNVVKYLPEEMAEYIYETGDEKTIAAAIENYLKLGILNREDALFYLQRIKSILNNFEEQQIGEKKQDQRRFFESLYGNSRNRVDVNEALSDLRNIQELVQKYERSQEENNSMDLDNNYEWDNEKFEYRNVDEKMQNFESLFSRSSMEGVIYQLAKLLFYQSFSINGFEAQESVKQLTNFLEKQIEEGRISRSMERKVFNILTAALADTLNEHLKLIISGKKNEKYGESNINLKEKNAASLTKNNVERKSVKMEEKDHRIVNNLKTSGIMDDKKIESSNN